MDDPIRVKHTMAGQSRPRQLQTIRTGLHQELKDVFMHLWGPTLRGATTQETAPRRRELQRTGTLALLGAACLLGMAPAAIAQEATPATAPAAASAPPAAAPDAPAAQTTSPSSSSAPAPADIPGQYIQTNAPEPKPASRVDLYGGYSFLKPSGSVGIFSFPQITTGYQFSVTDYFTKHFGVQLEFAHSYKEIGTTGPAPTLPAVQLGNTTGCFYNAEAGPVYRFFVGQHLVPFAHVVGGASKVGGPKFQTCEWGYGIAGGGGLDYILPGHHRHIALRVVQADYEYMHVDQGPITQYDLSGGSIDVSALRLAAGLVIRLGEMEPRLEKSLQCTASPADVYAGERVVVSANANNYNMHDKYFFHWQLSGGKTEGYGPAHFRRYHRPCRRHLHGDRSHQHQREEPEADCAVLGQLHCQDFATADDPLLG